MNISRASRPATSSITPSPAPSPISRASSDGSRQSKWRSSSRRAPSDGPSPPMTRSASPVGAEARWRTSGRPWGGAGEFNGPSTVKWGPAWAMRRTLAGSTNRPSALSTTTASESQLSNSSKTTCRCSANRSGGSSPGVASHADRPPESRSSAEKARAMLNGAQAEVAISAPRPMRRVEGIRALITVRGSGARAAPSSSASAISRSTPAASAAAAKAGRSARPMRPPAELQPARKPRTSIAPGLRPKATAQSSGKAVDMVRSAHSPISIWKVPMARVA